MQAQLGTEPVEVVLVPEFSPKDGKRCAACVKPVPGSWWFWAPRRSCLVAPVEKRIPVVFGLVANPYFTKAAYDPAHPRSRQENVTGIASAAPLAAALQRGVSLLGKVSWGLLYDPTDGVAVDLARRFESEAGRFEVRP